MKKLFYIFIFIIFGAFLVTAQNSLSEKGCGTPTFTSQDNQRRIDNTAYNSIAERSAQIYYIPCKMHLFGDDDGTGYYTRQQLLLAYCELNEQFSDASIRFFIQGTNKYITGDQLHFIPSSYYFNGLYSDRSELYSFNTSNVCNAYLLNQGNESFCGRSNLAGQFGGIELLNSCMQYPTNTFSHEMGHWLDLPHTFDGTGCKECVNQSNCKQCGDRFCDTPADYQDYSHGCNSTGPVDACGSGNPTTPNNHLTMSYSNGCFPYYFSNQQINGNPGVAAGMRATLLTNARKFLIDGNKNPLPPVVDTITVAQTLVYPLTSTDSLPYNYVMLTWNSVPNASLYHIMISKYSSFNNLVVDIFTADTFFIATPVTTLSNTMNKIDSFKVYYWKVKPFNPVYTCATYSGSKSFFAKGYSPTYIGKDKFPYLNSIKVFPNPVFDNHVKISLEANSSFEMQVSVYNVFGNLVKNANLSFQPGIDIQTLKLPELESGVYFLQLESEGGKYVQKLTVIR